MVLASPVTLHFRASSMAVRMAWQDSGAGMMPSARANWDAGLEGGDLVHCGDLDQALMGQLGDQGGGPVVAQAAGVGCRGA